MRGAGSWAAHGDADPAESVRNKGYIYFEQSTFFIFLSLWENISVLPACNGDGRVNGDNYDNNDSDW